MKQTDWKAYRAQLLRDPKVKSEWENSRIEYEIARSLISARLKKGLTQKHLAAKLNTRQSVISRVENAQTISSVSFLKRIAHVLDLPLKIQLG